MLAWLIVACEVGFWLFVLAGLISRYVFKQKRLSNVLLICTPIVDLVLLVATVIDLNQGSVASTVHGVAAVYIGVSVAFGHQMIQWADKQFAYRFAGGAKPPRKKKFGKEYARQERAGWYRHLLAWAIGCVLLFGIILYINNEAQTEALLGTIQIWSLVLAIDFIIAFSYTFFPKKES